MRKENVRLAQVSKLGGSGKGPLFIIGLDQSVVCLTPIESITITRFDVTIRMGVNEFKFTYPGSYISLPIDGTKEYTRWQTIFLARIIDRAFSSISEVTDGKFNFDCRVIDINEEFNASLNDLHNVTFVEGIGDSNV